MTEKKTDDGADSVRQLYELIDQRGFTVEMSCVTADNLTIFATRRETDFPTPDADHLVDLALTVFITNNTTLITLTVLICHATERKSLMASAFESLANFFVGFDGMRKLTATACTQAFEQRRVKMAQKAAAAPATPDLNVN